MALPSRGRDNEFTPRYVGNAGYIDDHLSLGQVIRLMQYLRHNLPFSSSLFCIASCTSENLDRFSLRIYNTRVVHPEHVLGLNRNEAHPFL
jgi:hypothetical protein